MSQLRASYKELPDYPLPLAHDAILYNFEQLEQIDVCSSWFRPESIDIFRRHGLWDYSKMSSVAYWFADRPARAVQPPSVEKRMPVPRDNPGRWLFDKKNQCPGNLIKLNPEMKRMKAVWAKEYGKGK